MRRSVMFLLLLVLSVPAIPASAAQYIVALKRDSGLTQGGAIDSRFTGLGSATLVTVKDAQLWNAGNARYYNYGTTTVCGSGTHIVVSFDLSAYTGGTVNLAQLRLRATLGNNNMQFAGLKRSWSEGNKDGNYPGVSPSAAGVSVAHPNGTHVDTTGPLGWGSGANAFLDFTSNGQDLYALADFSSMPAGADWVVANVTSLVQDWLSGTKTNYGLLVNFGNHPVYLSEGGTTYEPVLFLDVTTSGGGDTTAPAAVTNLATSSPTSSSITLTWTAPGDDGSTGTAASYDVRYRTGGAVNDSNWASASQATGEPTPQVAGTNQSMVVSGLSSSTTYYFAIKTSDEVPNTSAISNSPSGTTSAGGGGAAVTIQNPWLVNDRVADCRTLATMGTTFQKAYSPSGVTNPATNEDKVINEYNNFKRRCYHWAEVPTDNQDVVHQLNVFGWALCGSEAGMNCAVLESMSMSPRRISIASGGHTYFEANYGGKWHALDTMCTFYVYDRGNPRSIANMAEVQADKNLVLNAVAEGRACPGFLLCGDTPSYFANGSDTWNVLGTPGSWPTDKSMDMTLRMGEGLDRRCDSWANQYYNYPTNSPPYHHEAANDWKDTVNFSYWEPYEYLTAANSAIGISYSKTYRRWANGTINLAPDFRTVGYQAALLSSTNVSTYYQDGLTPDLHVAATGSLANVVYKITTPFWITDGNISGSFFRNSTSDINRILVSTNGTSYTTVWTHSTTGTTVLSNLNIQAQVKGTNAFWVKVELQAVGAVTNAGVSNLVVQAIFEHNKGGMAYLDKGVNNLTFTCGNPGDFGSNARMKIVYKWKEYDGANWTIDKAYVKYANASPTNFTIITGGTKVPRTEYISMDMVPVPPADTTAPSAVADLRSGGTTQTTVTLLWTAPGNDGTVGEAASYDLRRSTSLITAANFASATQVPNVPTPRPSGGAESFTVTGLTAGTTYYFAIKAADGSGNVAAISNVPSIATLPTDTQAPNAISNLAASAGGTPGSFNLTWTAPADNGGGYVASYDLRYSTSTITAGNFASATVISGLGTPKSAGSAESFTATNLPTGRTLYFAIKSADNSGNVSAISNVPSAQSNRGSVTLQNGVSGYASTTDSYIQQPNPTVNYNSTERMRVCGFGSGNYQRGILKFDLSSYAPNSTITSATLYVYAYDQASWRGSTGYYGMYPLTRAFTDSQVTWNIASTGVNWTTAGGDFNGTADGTAPKQGSASVWYQFSVTSRVQSMINGPSGNYGWVLKCMDESLSNQDSFYQASTTNSTYRPKLVINDN